jgi:hypothetical protein
MLNPEFVIVRTELALRGSQTSTCIAAVGRRELRQHQGCIPVSDGTPLPAHAPHHAEVDHTGVIPAQDVWDKVK